MKWSIKYNLDRCKGCGRDDVPHKALGLCKNCYVKSTGYAHQKKHAKDNRAEVTSYAKEWRKFNPSSVKASRKTWSDANPDKTRRYIRNWRTRNKPEFCMICGETRVVDWAHIIPHRDNGPVVDWNMLPLCPNHHRCYDFGLLTVGELEHIQPFLDNAKIQFALLK